MMILAPFLITLLIAIAVAVVAAVVIIRRASAKKTGVMAKSEELNEKSAEDRGVIPVGFAWREEEGVISLSLEGASSVPITAIRVRLLVNRRDGGVSEYNQSLRDLCLIKGERTDTVEFRAEGDIIGGRILVYAVFEDFVKIKGVKIADFGDSEAIPTDAPQFIDTPSQTPAKAAPIREKKAKPDNTASRPSYAKWVMIGAVCIIAAMTIILIPLRFTSTSLPNIPDPDKNANGEQGDRDDSSDPQGELYTLTYEIREDEEYCTLTGMTLNYPPEHYTQPLTVTVPSHYEGYPVESIGYNAFRGKDNIQYVILPDTVRVISNYAFEGCVNLRSVEMQEGVEYLWEGAFANCPELSLTIPTTVTKIENGVFVNSPNLLHYLEGGWYVCDSSNNLAVLVDMDTSVSEVEIPYSVRFITLEAFEECDQITSLTLPTEIIGIEPGALGKLTSLTTLYISMRSLGANDLEGLWGLTDLTINIENKYIEGGALSHLTGLRSLTVRSLGAYAGMSLPQPLGYFFGTSERDGLEPVEQFYESSASPSNSGGSTYTYYVPTSLTSVTVNGGKIPHSAFTYCDMLTDVYLGDEVVYIGTSAFEGCTSLVNVRVSSDVDTVGYNAFKDCTSLSYNLIDEAPSNGLGKYLGNELVGWVILMEADPTDTATNGYRLQTDTRVVYQGAFDGVTELAFLEVGANLASFNSSFAHVDIGYVSISDLASWVKVRYESGYTCCPQRFADGIKYQHQDIVELNLPDEITEIGKYAFYGATTIERVVLPGSLKRIGDNAFEGCESLTGVVMSPSVTCIGSYAFSCCSALSSIILYDNLTEIGPCAFADCSSLSSISIPSSVTVMGEGAFDRCDALLEIVDGVHYVGKWVVGVDDGVILAEIREGTVGISAYTFNNNDDIQSVVLPDGLLYIGNSSFYGCDNLRSISLPDSVLSIGNYCFDNLPNLSYTVYEGSSYIGCASNPYVALAKANESVSDLILPQGVRHVLPYAFFGSVTYNNVVLPEGLRTLCSFASLSAMRVTVPSSVTYIGYFALNASGESGLNYDSYGNGYFGNDENPYMVLVYVPWVWMPGTELLIVAEGCEIIASCDLREYHTTVVLPSTLRFIADDTLESPILLRILYNGSYSWQSVTVEVSDYSFAEAKLYFNYDHPDADGTWYNGSDGYYHITTENGYESIK